VHQRDLTGGAAKANETQFEPKAHCLPKTNLRGLVVCGCVHNFCTV
jgi:hypothetical protein